LNIPVPVALSDSIFSLSHLSEDKQQNFISHCKGEISKKQCILSRGEYYPLFSRAGVSNSDYIHSRAFGFISKKDLSYWRSIVSFLNSYKAVFNNYTLSNLSKDYFKFYNSEPLIKILLSLDLYKDLSSEVIKRNRKVSESYLSSESGRAERKKKIEQTNIQRYGSPSPLQNDEVKKKIEQTNLHRYGISNPIQNYDIKEKATSTLISNHGVSNPFHSEELLSKAYSSRKENKFKKFSSLLHKHGYSLLGDFKGVRNFTEEGKYESYVIYSIKCHKCGLIFEDDIYCLPRCPQCFKSLFSSNMERYYEGYISSLDFLIERDYLCSYRKVSKSKSKTNHEIDLFMRNLNIGFEINGLYFHSSGGDRPDRFKGKFSIKEKTSTYHQQKTSDCLSKGISLYHIWESDREEIVKSMISSILGKSSRVIFARKCNFSKITYSEAEDFLNINHLHGAKSSGLCFGLYHDSELVSVITYRKIANTSSYELARAAGKINTSIPGGFSKLFKNSLPFLRKLFCDKVISYADRDWSPDPLNTVYQKAGFSYEGDTGSILRYTDFKRVYSRERFQKHKLKKLFPESYSDSLTANQILSLQGIYPIYNSGNHKFSYSL